VKHELKALNRKLNEAKQTHNAFLEELGLPHLP
jgi:hypothetical protein